jgi:hypothetical protein
MLSRIHGPAHVKHGRGACACAGVQFPKQSPGVELWPENHAGTPPTVEVATMSTQSRAPTSTTGKRGHRTARGPGVACGAKHPGQAHSENRREHREQPDRTTEAADRQAGRPRSRRSTRASTRCTMNDSNAPAERDGTHPGHARIPTYCARGRAARAIARRTVATGDHAPPSRAGVGRLPPTPNWGQKEAER